ncbi:hypothetical protein ACS0TY_001390 [Phlomoides rotata]
MKITLAFSLYQILVVCILILSFNKTCCLTTSNHPISTSFITKSCHTTLYPHLCNATLAKYAKVVKKSPKRLAITALLVTLKTTRSASEILKKLSRNGALKRGEKAAVVECVEEVGDAVYELRRTLKEINHTRKGRPNFELQINDLQTWVSAALTDEDTCMDDFTFTTQGQGKIKIFVRRLVLTLAHFSSIALSFVNNFAALA